MIKQLLSRRKFNRYLHAGCLTTPTLGATITSWHGGRHDMPSGHGERYDFFLSRRGSVAAIAQEVEQVLAQKSYSVLTQETSRSHRVLSRRCTRV